jgi:hypothetical protein
MIKHTLILASIAILLLSLIGCDSESGAEGSSNSENKSGSNWDLSGKVEWHTTTSGGVAGVWNPQTKKVEWHTTTSGGVAGVWNPQAKKVEWHTTTSGGVAGVFVPNNPSDYQQYLRSKSSN